MENLDILASNGFGLTVDESAPYGQGEKIRLTAMPVSKETTFDEKGPSVHLRLSSFEQTVDPL